MFQSEKKILWRKSHFKMPKERSHCICLSVILIDSVFKMGKNYCALKCFYKEKKNKIPIYITDDIETSDDPDE